MANIQQIHPNDSWVLDSDNKVIGVQTKNTTAEFGNVTATTDPLTGKIQTIAKLTQAQYDAIAVKDDSTLYVIVA